MQYQPTATRRLFHSVSAPSTLQVSVTGTRRGGQRTAVVKTSAVKMTKTVAVSPWCLMGALFICAAVSATSVGPVGMADRPWLTAGPLPCGENLKCECAFRQRGCCCAANDVFRLEESTYIRMAAMWEDWKRLEGEIQTLGGRDVAFTATLTRGSFGPFTNSVPIPYNNITLNRGSSYNKALGTFTAQRDGVYSFTFTAFSDVESRIYHQVQLVRNGALIASVWEDNREDLKDSATQTVLLRLSLGDLVYVQLKPGRKLRDPEGNRNVFSGFLLYPSH